MKLTKFLTRSATPILLAALCACSGKSRPDYVADGRDDRAASEAGNYAPEDVFAAPSDSDEAERAAAKAIRDIEDRVGRGELPKIQFEFDKADITPESTPTLDLIADVLRSDEHLKLMINAHCDAVGSDEYNLDLSKRRAKSVSDYLASKGVLPPSMRFHGFGASKPIASNATEEGRAKNRRVEFYIMTREWKAVY
jgi:outer membrane protein OmpA-like peptidoglycan-associated protein